MSAPVDPTQSNVCGSDFVEEKRTWVIFITQVASATLGGAIVLLNVITGRQLFTSPHTLAPFFVCLISLISLDLLRRGLQRASAHVLVSMIFVVVWLLNLHDAYTDTPSYHTLYILAGLVPPSLLLGKNWSLVYGALSLVIVAWMSALLARAGYNWTPFAVDHTATIIFVSIFATIIAHVYSLALNTSRELYARLCESVEDRLQTQHNAEMEQRRFLRETVLCVTQGKLDICDEEDIAPYTMKSDYLQSVEVIADVPSARRRALEFCRSSGLNEQMGSFFEPAVGEGITNAVKHAGQGRIFAGKTDTEVWVAVTDDGPGITTLLLPRVALIRGFSTTTSLGLGYTMMLDAADRVLLHTSFKGTRLVLVKKLAGKPTAPILENLTDAW